MISEEQLEADGTPAEAADKTEQAISQEGSTAQEASSGDLGEKNVSVSEDKDNTVEAHSRKHPEEASGNRIPGIAVTAVFALAALWFFLQLCRLKVLPAGYMILIGAALALLTGAVALLTAELGKKVKFAAGSVLTAAGAVALIFGSVALSDVRRTIDDVVKDPDETQAAQVGVYVRADDAAQSVDELRAEVFGIVGTIDRADTDRAINALESELGWSIELKEYGTFAELTNSLLSGEIRVMILDSGYLEVLSGMSGFSDVSTQVRQLTSYRMDVIVVPTQVPSGEDGTEAEPEATTIHPASPTETWEEMDPLDPNVRPSKGDHHTTEATTEATTAWVPPATTTSAAPAIYAPNGNVFTVYISGIDNRGAMTYRALSDVNILAVVNMNSKQLLLISTPRDFYIPFPVLGGARDKLTHAGTYGPQASMDTLRWLYGVTSDYYVRIGFQGFRQIIDAVGGVTVYSQYAFSFDGADFVVGNNDLNGSSALKFVRARKNVPGGDRTRGTNQMSVIKAVLSKLMSTGAIMNYSSILGAASGNMETSMPYDKIAALAQSMISGGWNITSYSVNGSDSAGYCPTIGQSPYVMWPSYDTVFYAQSLIRRVYNGEWVNP